MAEWIMIFLLAGPWLGAIVTGLARRAWPAHNMQLLLILASLLQLGIMVWWLLADQGSQSLDWILTNAETRSAFPTVTLDELRATALMGIAGVMCLLGWNRAEAPSSNMFLLSGWCGWGAANLYWISDDIMLSFLAQVGLLGLGCLVLAWMSSQSSGTHASRQLWIGVTCGDAILWALTLWWFLEFQRTTWDSPAVASHWQELAKTSPAVVTALGLWLWCGTLARGWQFPFGLTCDSAADFPSKILGWQFCVVLAPMGWRWMSTGLPIFWSSPECYQLIQGAALLSACLAAWFSLCSDDPRIRSAWLAAWHWSFVIVALLIDENHGQSWSWLVGTSGLLSLATLLTCWVPATESLDQYDSTGDDSTTQDEPRIVAFTSQRTRSSGDWNWNVAFQGITTQLATVRNRSPMSRPQPIVMFQGGRVGLFCQLILFSSGPFVVAAMSASSEPSLTENTDFVWSPMPLVALGAGVLAMTQLLLKTPSRVAKTSAGYWLPACFLPVVPWVTMQHPQVFWEAIMRASSSLQFLATMAAMVIGIVLGLVFHDRSGESPPRRYLETLSRLGRRRLYLPQIWLLGWNLPLRGMAQLTRFLDWFVIDGVVLKGLGFLTRWSHSSPAELQNHDPGFYALSVSLGAVAVTITLIWLSL